MGGVRWYAHIGVIEEFAWRMVKIAKGVFLGMLEGAKKSIKDEEK